MRRLLTFAFSLGFYSMVLQLVLIREFLIAFHGNELSMAIVLGNWLLLVGIGSLLLRGRGKRSLNVMIPILCIYSPVSVFLVRETWNLLGVSMGELIGVSEMIAYSFIVLLPLCILIGGSFSAACGVAGDKQKIGRIYASEALGSVSGGVVFSFLLVMILSPLQISLLASFIFGACSIPVVGRWMLAIPLISIALIPMPLEEFSLENRWGKYQEVRDSVYGNIAVLESQGNYNFYENGVYAFSTKSTEFSEELVHFPMLEHRSPKRVLLIGGGFGGALREIQKYNSSVRYVELDPLLVEIASGYIGEEDKDALNRSEVSKIDGRHWVKQAREKYDVVIVNLPPPSTAQLNRFYTIEFFQEVRAVLNPGGILSITLPPSESYIGREMKMLAGSIYSTMQRCFEHTLAVSGDYNLILMGSDSELTLNYSLLVERMEERGIRNVYVTQLYIPYRLSEQKIEATKFYLSGVDEMNHDMRPISYYYDMLLWSATASPAFKEFLEGISKMDPSKAYILIIPLASMALLRKRKTSLIFSMGAVGMSGMTLQLTLLLGFQVLYGYVYYAVGIITSSFMVGLWIGSDFSSRREWKKMHASAICISLAAYSFILPKLMQLPHEFAWIFSLLMFFAGVEVGSFFPLAGRMYPEERSGIVGGSLYSADLIGAWIGAMMSAVLIAIFGIPQLCTLVAMVNLVAFILLITSP